MPNKSMTIEARLTHNAWPLVLGAEPLTVMAGTRFTTCSTVKKERKSYFVVDINGTECAVWPPHYRVVASL